MKTIFTVTLLLFSIALGAQYNIDSISHVNYSNLHATELNDVWGYTDELGNEYGLIGAQTGVSVLDLSIPAQPQEILWHPSKTSVWRDIKTYGDYAYVTTEADTGLLILDLTALPSSTTIPTSYFYGANNDMVSAHNLWIDENGFCYIFGSNLLEGGVQIYDLNSSPTNPTKVGEVEQWYCHDGFVRNDTAFFAHIYDGFFSVYDLSDKANPVLLGTKETPTSFAHNIWPSDDGNTVYTTDEITDSYVAAYDVSNPASIVELDKVQSNPGTKTIPHNTHVLGDFLITSYYADGLIIHDASDPQNLIEVGEYDTYPGTSPLTVGNWGAYPYFQSGIILATDISNGLFILNPTYTNAATLEGITTNAQTNAPLEDVEVSIENHELLNFSKLNGSYKTGISFTGTREVNYYKYAFEEEQRLVNFIEGQMVTEDVALTPIPPFDLTVNVEDENGNPIFNAEVVLSFPQLEVNTVSNGFGEADFTLYYADDYDITVGKWGYFTSCNNYFIDENTMDLTIVLQTGFYDDFTFDFGWSSISNAQKGDFVRAVPNGHGDVNAPIQLYEDSQWDCGDKAYITGNGNIFDDVYEGTVSITSPVFDATYLTDPYVNYRRFFYCFHGDFSPNDSLKVFLSNGIETKLIDIQGSSDVYFTNKSIRISDFLTPTQNMQIKVETSDFEPFDNVTEIVFDHFYLTNMDLSSIKDESGKLESFIYPNPTNGIVHLTAMENQRLIIWDNSGSIVFQQSISAGENNIDLSHLDAGIYYLNFDKKSEKLIVQ